MFSLRGFDNWFWDTQALIWIPLWEWIELFMRAERGDWSYQTNEAKNDIDMNRLFVKEEDADPYDFAFVSNRVNGVDCNGSKGNGYYCYCPSQGYQCKCKKSDWYDNGEKRFMCYDHFGYNCSGDFVDGAENWCTDK